MGHEKLFKKVERSERRKKIGVEIVEKLGDWKDWEDAEKSENKEEDDKTSVEEAIVENLKKNNITVGKIHVICIGGSSEKSKFNEKQLEDENLEKKEAEKAQVSESHNCSLTATVFQLKGKKDAKENELKNIEQNTGIFVKDNTSPDTDDSNVKLSSIDLGNNLRKMFNSAPKKQLGARPKESEKTKESEKVKESEKIKEESKITEEKKEKEKICWNCHASESEEGVKLSKCKGCRKARYCDEECQSSDWERHSSYCEKMQEKRKKKEEKIEE